MSEESPVMYKTNVIDYGKITDTHVLQKIKNKGCSEGSMGLWRDESDSWRFLIILLFLSQLDPMRRDLQKLTKDETKKQTGVASESGYVKNKCNYG